MKNFLIVLVFAACTACADDDKNAAEDTQTQPIAQSKNSSDFNTSFANLLDHYYHLKDALVLTNDTMAKSAATALAYAAENFPESALAVDSSIAQMASGYIQSVAAEAKGLAGEKDIEAKRKSFQLISDVMYDLVRTVRYDRETVYHQYCPMAFNDAGAYWLSKTTDIKNPYFGKKMLTCGEVKDSLRF